MPDLKVFMKIAFIVYQFIREKGGVESYVFNLSKQLLDRGYEIHVFAHRFSLDKDKRLFFHHVPAVNFWSPLKHWTFALNAPKVLKRSGIKFDLIHGFTQTFFQDIYRVGGGCHWDYMMSTYPLMQSLPGRIIMCLNPRHLSLLLLEKIIFKGKYYKQVTCISELCRSEIVRHYKLPMNEIEVIYNGVDVHVFTPENRLRYRNDMRAGYAVASDEILLLFVGSGFKRKGLKYAIDVLSLADKPQKTKLLVVGKGDFQKYRQYAKGKGVAHEVIFAGVCKNMHEIYAASDILIFPSEYDAFGTVCLEAMASGLPVIVSKMSGASEIITHGKDGFVINHPISAREIVQYVNLLLEKEKRDQVGLAARQKSEVYSFEANTEKIVNIYRKILRR